MTQLFTKNKKIKDANNKNNVVYNFGIPANEKNCRKCKLGKYCYAKQGAYNWSQVKNAYQYRYECTQSPQFVDIVVQDLQAKAIRASKQSKQLIIRVHDSGDYYSTEYALKWMSIASKLPQVQFYSYTKEVGLFKSLSDSNNIPSNYTIIYSIGGTEDHLIDLNNDRHARIFKSLTELLDAGYVNAMLNDLIAIGPNNKIGLVYHGVRKYNKDLK